MNFENYDFSSQYEELLRDEEWDKYLEECAINSVPSMPYSVWACKNCPNKSKR